MVDPSLFASDLRQRTKPYVVGYSGCIPGMSHRIGQTFGRASEDCIALFTRQLEQRQARKESEERRAKSLPRMKSSRSRPYHIQEDSQNTPYLPYQVYARSSYVSPPIPGYTGYIPHMKCTEVGIGRTYGAAARKGIQKVMNARQRMQANLSNQDIF
ncbi:UNVERIFIED_CONTAM: hypothetical protein RMT77_013583 [Armadillidium vulgare]